jgi:hypothetical protein
MRGSQLRACITWLTALNPSVDLECIRYRLLLSLRWEAFLLCMSWMCFYSVIQACVLWEVCVYQISRYGIGSFGQMEGSSTHATAAIS